jgi:hypothetical protein
MAIRGFTYTYAALSLPLDYGKIIIVVSRQHRHKTGTEGLGLTNYQININAGTCRATLGGLTGRYSCLDKFKVYRTQLFFTHVDLLHRKTWFDPKALRCISRPKESQGYTVLHCRISKTNLEFNVFAGERILILLAS